MLALALAILLASRSRPNVAARLDVTGVELSFAETVVETAAVRPLPPSVSREMRLASEPPLSAPPSAPPLDLPAPDVSAVAVFPEMHETPEPLDREPNESRAPHVSAGAAPAAPAPRQARIDAPARPRRNIRADYPRQARERKEQGDVTVQLDVAVDGSVSAAHVSASSGYPELDASALAAVRKARFIPAQSGGVSVSSSARIVVQFKLR